MGHGNLTHLSATDCADRLEVVCDLCSTSPDLRGQGIPFIVRVPEKVEPRVPSLTSLYRSADFREREIQV
jgi:NADH:ubiquinone oxidoreductase subunit C